MIVEPARPEDTADLARLLSQYLTVTEQEKAARGLAEPGPLPQRYQDEIDHPERLLADALLARNESDNRPLGVVVLKTDATQVEVKRLWVDPQARGTGTGRALMQAAQQRAGDRPVTLTVWDWRAAPIALYQSLGFTRTVATDGRERLLSMIFQTSK